MTINSGNFQLVIKTIKNKKTKNIHPQTDQHISVIKSFNTMEEGFVYLDKLSANEFDSIADKSLCAIGNKSQTREFIIERLIGLKLRQDAIFEFFK